MKTALIIPSVVGEQRQAMVGRCIESIAAAQETPDWIAVVYQGAEDQSATAAIKNAYPHVEVLWATRRGASAARNTGAAISGADLLLFVDDDCVVDPRLLATYRAAFESDAALMAAGGQVKPMNSWSDQGAPLALKAAEQAETYQGRRNPIGTIDRGANLAVRATAFQTVGGFDVRLGPGTAVKSGEDVDFAYRLLRAGFRLRYFPDAIIFHDQWRTPEEAVAVERGYGLGAGAFLGKHLRGGDLYAAWLVVWILGMWGVRPVVDGIFRRSRHEFRHGLLHLTSIPRGLWFGLTRLPPTRAEDGLGDASRSTEPATRQVAP